MARKRHRGYSTRTDVCKPVAAALREFGYPSVTHDQIKEVLDAWLTGKREGDLPHGVIGMMAGRRFDEVEEAKPGSLAILENA